MRDTSCQILATMCVCVYVCVCVCACVSPHTCTCVVRTHGEVHTCRQRDKPLRLHKNHHHRGRRCSSYKNPLCFRCDYTIYLSATPLECLPHKVECQSQLQDSITRTCTGFYSLLVRAMSGRNYGAQSSCLHQYKKAILIPLQIVTHYSNKVWTELAVYGKHLINWMCSEKLWTFNSSSTAPCM